MTVAEEIRCPECRAGVVVERPWPAWCERCEWGVEQAPRPDPAPQGRREKALRAWERVEERAGRRLGDLLLRDLSADGSPEALRPRLTAGTMLAYAIAACVHLGWLALLGVTIALVILGFSQPLAFFFALFPGALAIFARPRLSRRVDPEEVIDPARAPSLHAHVRAVADALGTAAPDRILVTAAFNASWSADGLRRRTSLELGLPLLCALTPEERTALIAHELAHARNRDLRRGLVLGVAIDTLVAVYAALAPDVQLVDDEPMEVMAWLTDELTRVIVMPVGLALLVLAMLTLRDSQRAEFLADDGAASVAGTRAVVAMHEKLLLATTFVALARRSVHDGAEGLFDRLEHAFMEMPERERRRRQLAARREAARLWVTHPPTGQRIALLEARPHRDPALVLDGLAVRRIDDELAPRRAPLARRLTERWTSALHY